MAVVVRLEDTDKGIVGIGMCIGVFLWRHKPALALGEEGLGWDTSTLVVGKMQDIRFAPCSLPWMSGVVAALCCMAGRYSEPQLQNGLNTAVG